MVEFAHGGSLDSLNGSRELCAGLACDSEGVLHVHVLDTGELTEFESKGLTEQQVFVHRSGKVIFSAARCWSNKRFCESKRKTEKARCKSPRLMFVIKWPINRDRLTYGFSLFPMRRNETEGKGVTYKSSCLHCQWAYRHCPTQCTPPPLIEPAPHRNRRDHHLGARRGRSKKAELSGRGMYQRPGRE